MSRVGANKISRSVVGWLVALLALNSGVARAKTKQRPSAGHGTTGPVVVEVSAQAKELLTNYLHWMIANDIQFSKPKALIPAPPQGKLPDGHVHAPQTSGTIHMPSIDLYAPSGASLYHSEDPEKNPAFIRGLPSTMRALGHANLGGVRPTLKEVLAMFTELKPYQAAVQKSKYDTVFALTFPADRARCQAQDLAIQQLEKRAADVGVNVVEVRLHN